MPLAVLGFLVAVAYLPLSLQTTAGRWAVVAAAVPALWTVRINPGPGHWLLLATLLWITVGLFWSVSPLDTLGELAQWAGLAAVFCLAAEEPDLRRCWAAYAAGLAVSVPFSIAQLLGHEPVWNLSTSGAGLFVTKNAVVEASLPGIVLALLLPGRWKLLAVPPAALILMTDPSREWLLGAGAAAIAWAWFSVGWRGRFALAGAVEAAALLAHLAGWLDQAHLGLMTDRRDIWALVVDNLTWFGRGLGSFSSIFSGWGHIDGHEPFALEYAHSDPLQLAFDLGVGALLVGGLFAFAMFDGPAGERAALAALLACSTVWFPLHGPASAFMAALLAGGLCGARRRARAALADGELRRRLGPPDPEHLGAGTLQPADLRRHDLPFRPRRPAGA